MERWWRRRCSRFLKLERFLRFRDVRRSEVEGFGRGVEQLFFFFIGTFEPGAKQALGSGASFDRINVGGKAVGGFEGDLVALEGGDDLEEFLFF